MSGTSLQEEAGRYFFTTGKRLPVTLMRGQGTKVWDDEGKEFLDFFGGPSVTSLGHCHPEVVNAIIEQAQKLIYYSNSVYTAPQVQLARLLVENSCLDRVYFCNSGAEANEGAFKLARKWGKEQKGGAYEIICAENSFHGRTLATITAGGTERYRAPFTPLPDGFVHVPFNDVAAIKNATSEKTVAVLLEPIQGEGGVNIPSDSYLRLVRSWCDEAGLLLILDEVQTGIGRCGALFAYQLYGIEPDIITLGKGLGSGVPLAAFMAKERANVFAPGDHGSTYGGNPLCTSVGYRVLKYVLDHDLPTQAARRGQYLMQKLSGIEDRHSAITMLRGKGLLCAVQFAEDRAEEITLACLDHGLIANNVRPNAIRLSPPLTVTEDEIDQAVAILERVLAEKTSSA